MHVEANGEPVLVEGNGDTVEMNEDAVGSTNGERKPEPVCTGVSRGGQGRRRAWWGDLIFSASVRVSAPGLGTGNGVPAPAPISMLGDLNKKMSSCRESKGKLWPDWNLHIRPCRTF